MKGIILFVIYFVTLAFLSIRNNNVYTNIFLEFKVNFNIFIIFINYTTVLLHVF